MNHFQNTFTLILFFLMVLVGCQNAAMNTAEDSEAIETMITQILEAINSGDASSAAIHWSENGSFLPPNMAKVEGRENIQGFLQGMIDSGLKELKAKTASLEVNGDMAFRIGDYTLTMQPEGMEPMQDNGKFVQVFKRENGTWKLVVGIFNSNMPMPSAM